MTGFSDLSNELVLEILRHVDPPNIDSACFITKSISLLAAPILEEHRRLKQQYASCEGSYASIKYAKYQDDAFPKLLIEILAKPRLAYYVRNLKAHCHCYDNSYEASASWHDSVHHIRTVIEDMEIVPANEIDEWLSADQDTIPSLALLLVCLPYLTSLKLQLDWGVLDRLLKATRRIENAPAGTFLLHLKSVSIDCNMLVFDEFDSERSDVIEFFASLLASPSLASFHVEGLDLQDEGCADEWDICPQRFNVTDLSFSECRIGDKMLFQLLGKVGNLESFEFVSPGRLDWYWLGVGLIHYAKHSLKKLRLQPGRGVIRDARSEISSLRELVVLQEIHTDPVVFLKDDESDVRRFQEHLPASIQRIYLNAQVDPSLSNEAVSEIMERVREVVLSLLEVQNMVLPHLTDIHVLTEREAHASIFADVPHACQPRGISFHLELGSPHLD